MTRSADEWRRHWPAVAASSLGVATGFSMLQFNASIFIQPWQDSFGWSRGEIAAAHNGMILTALLSPFAGALLDRVGVRRPLLAAMFLMGCAYIAMAQLNGSLIQYYATYLVLQFVGIFTTGLAFTRVVAARFVRSRGLALACTRIGISLFGIFLPPLLHWLIDHKGWPAGFYLLAAVVLLVGLPICWLGIRDMPRARPEETRPRESFLTLVRLNRKVVQLCICAALGYVPITMALSQFQPLLTELSIAPQDAATLTGVLAGSVLLGTLLSGVLIDRVWAPAVACLFSVGPIIGFALMLSGALSFPVAFGAAVLIGASQGAEIDVVAYLSARYFGMRHYSTIYGSTVATMAMAGVAGQVGIGFLHDYAGSYHLALIVMITILALSIPFYLMLGAYPERPEDE